MAYLARAVTAVSDADKAVKAATKSFQAKAKEVSEKEALEKAKAARLFVQAVAVPRGL